MNSLNLVDFHVVCFFNCGSLHSGKGERFRLADMVPAAECVRRIAKPCIAYKIMGAGRIHPEMAFEYAFENIADGRGQRRMHRGDKDDMVEENVAIVRRQLGGEAATAEAGRVGRIISPASPPGMQGGLFLGGRFALLVARAARLTARWHSGQVACRRSCPPVKLK